MADIDTSEFPPTNGRGGVLVVRQRLLVVPRSAAGAAGAAFPCKTQVGGAVSVASDDVSSPPRGAQVVGRGSGRVAYRRRRRGWPAGQRRRRRRPSCRDSGQAASPCRRAGPSAR
jgi:hypothetical protein